MPLILLKRSFDKYIRGKGVRILAEYHRRKESPIIERNLLKFISKHMVIREIKSLRSISKNDYDCIVVGSDQIWRPWYFRGEWRAKTEDAFLKFADGWDIKRISYAASFGVDQWEYSDKESKIIANLLNSFDGVSVRENFSVNLMRKHLSISSSFVLDPTMLLDSDDYNKLTEGFDEQTFQKVIVSYILDTNEEIEAFISKISTEKSLAVVRINSDCDNIKLTVEARIQPPIENWLSAFRNTDFIITDSFHACVFSIIYRKPFIVLGNKNRGLGRFISLLETFQLMDHLIFRLEDYDSTRDYSIGPEVEQVIDRMRTHSYTFLNNVLNERN